MQKFDEVTAVQAADLTRDPITGLPPRTTVIEREIQLAQRQLNGYTRTLRYDGHALGEEIEPPAEGEMRTQLLAEIERLERHLEALSTPVVMPDLMLRSTPNSSER
jgi:hypothetical protein